MDISEIAPAGILVSTNNFLVGGRETCVATCLNTVGYSGVRTEQLQVQIQRLLSEGDASVRIEAIAYAWQAQVEGPYSHEEAASAQNLDIARSTCCLAFVGAKEAVLAQGKQ